MIALAPRVRNLGTGPVEIWLAGTPAHLHAAGFALLPDAQLMIVADLHLEKASHFASSGQMLPPYDSLMTLEALDAAVQREEPRAVALLGDSFHRTGQGLPEAGRVLIDRIARKAALIWITGNHDPVLPDWLPGIVVPAFEAAGIVLRHEPVADGKPEIFGHFHPCARLMTRAGMVRRRCFLETQSRLVLPAFGALTGSLDATGKILSALFPAHQSRAHLLAGQQLHTVPGTALANFNPAGR